MPHSPKVLIVLVSALGLTACGEPATKPAVTPAAPAASDYLAPPSAEGVARRGQTLILSGKAAPLALVRLATPGGSAVGVTAGADGRWTVEIGAVPAPAIFSLAQDVNGRLVRGRGYVLGLPGPTAAVLGPGVATRPLQAQSGVASVDYDGGGAAVISGRAAPNAPVRLALDGAEAGEGKAGPDGRYNVALASPVRSGAHTVAVRTPQGASSATFEVSPPAAIAAPPFAARRLDRAWRIDWMPPGGGVQSTILFDSPQTQSGAGA